MAHSHNETWLIASIASRVLSWLIAAMERDRAPQTQDKYVVRFPDGMRERLKLAAEANKRSMNAEIVARLQQTLDEDAALDPERLDYALVREMLTALREGRLQFTRLADLRQDDAAD